METYTAISSPFTTMISSSPQQKVFWTLPNHFYRKQDLHKVTQLFCGTHLSLKPFVPLPVCYPCPMQNCFFLN